MGLLVALQARNGMPSGHPLPEGRCVKAPAFHNVRSVPCTTCGAPIGRLCLTTNGSVAKLPHATRCALYSIGMQEVQS